MSLSVGSYWSAFARSFASLGPPLRPSREDLEITASVIGKARAGNPGIPLRALLLGVTPELAALPWPNACTLLAADSCLTMIQAVWPGDVPGRRWAVHADWSSLPLARSSTDIVVGDGSANCVRYPEGLRALARGVSGLMHCESRLVLRLYTQLESPESAGDVFAGIDSPALPTFHHFKFRLLMAMQEDVLRGVRVQDVYRAWHANGNRRASRLGAPGWEPEALETIEFYRDAGTVHTFPTLTEFRAVLLEFFDEVAIHTPRYALGERCPTLVLKARRAGARP